MTTLELTGILICIGDMSAEDMASFPAGVPGVMLALPGGRALLIAGLTRDECRVLAPSYGEQIIVTLREKLQGEQA